jgi:hypothetical protein
MFTHHRSGVLANDCPSGGGGENNLGVVQHLMACLLAAPRLDFFAPHHLLIFAAQTCLGARNCQCGHMSHYELALSGPNEHEGRSRGSIGLPRNMFQPTTIFNSCGQQRRGN